MTLIKSILLGSAAGIVVVASAQAADLPTKKAAPVAEYVKICNVGGITGWTLPGSDTCVKFSGYITGQFVGGNLNTHYRYGDVDTFLGVNAAQFNPFPVPASLVNPITGVPVVGSAHGWSQVNQRVLIQDNGGTWARDETGWTTRANFGFDFASNTAYGPLIGHFDINADSGSGLDNTGTTAVLNTGYLTWAGITAGMAPSFYSFVGGGPNWANFFSADRKGYNQPDLLAYTASFGGGFSATLSAENPQAGARGNGTQMGFPNNGLVGANNAVGSPLDITYGGVRWPDFVGALHVTQGWGEAQLSGVVHNVNVRAIGVGAGDFYNNAFDCGILGIAPCNGEHNQTGWGIDAGVKVLLPQFGAGDFFLLTGAYTQSAVWYSGLPDGMWGPPEMGAVNGNGQPMYMADAYFNPLTNQWSKPTAWSIQAWLEHHFTPQFYLDLLGGYGELTWSNMGGGCYVLGFGCGAAQVGSGPLSKQANTWIIGADLGWVPVTNLNFDLELMYQDTTQNRPSGFVGTIYNFGLVNPNGTSAAFVVPGAWQGNSSGFAGRLRITRYF